MRRVDWKDFVFVQPPPPQSPPPCPTPRAVECPCVSSLQTIYLLLKWIHYIWRSGLSFNLEHIGKRREKKNPLGFIFPASAILLWLCSEICFHQADSIRELGNEKRAIELDGEGGGEGGAGGGIVSEESAEKLRKGWVGGWGGGVSLI